MNPQHTTAIKHFFCGGWFEWFTLGKTLEEAKQKGKNCAFSYARNTKIELDNENKHGLDIVFLPMGKEPTVVEYKSGGFRRSIEKYVYLRKRLNLPDGRFMILVVDLEESQAIILGSMYGLTFVTPKSMMEHLRMAMWGRLKKTNERNHGITRPKFHPSGP